MEYRRAFWEAVRKQPWWQWVGVLLFNVFNLSGADFVRLWLGLAPGAKDIFWTAGLLLTAYLTYRTGRDVWRKVQDQNAVLEARLRPWLQIVFDPTQYQACLQSNKWKDPDGTDVIWRLVQIALVNVSEGETLDDVEAFLTDLQVLNGAQHAAFLPAPLSGIDEVGPFRLNPGRTPIFLKIAEKQSAGYYGKHIHMFYGQPDSLLEPDKPYRLRIVAKCRNAPEVEALFNMYVDAEGILQFEQASQSRPTAI